MEKYLKKQKTGPGVIKVAKYYPGKTFIPTETNMMHVLIHTKDEGLGGGLSPYVMKDENGCLLENKWQFSKVYKKVDAQKIPLSRWQPDKIIWEHPSEIHVDEQGNVTDIYKAWREKGYQNQYAVRYPNGFHGRSKCLYSLWPNSETGLMETLGYIDARKKIYFGEYTRIAPQLQCFKNLQKMHLDGVNIQIWEVDGPDPTLTYPPYDQISGTNPGMTMTKETLNLLINDPKKPFGHGFAIAALLMGIKDF